MLNLTYFKGPLGLINTENKQKLFQTNQILDDKRQLCLCNRK